jgi:AraC-like DNA-binding protein
MNKEKNPKKTNILLHPAIASTHVSLPDGIMSIRPGNPCDDQKAIVDEMHFGGRTYSPRLLFNVSLSNNSSWCPGTILEREKSNITVLSFVISGEGELIVDDRKYTLLPNDIYFFHKDEKHTLRALPGDRFCRHTLTLSGGFSPELIEQMGIRDISRVRLSKSNAAYVLGEIKTIDKFICEKPKDFLRKISVKLFDLLLFIANEVYGDPEIYVVPDHVEMCMEYVMNNLDKPLNVIQLANVAHTSVRNLNRSFMKSIGVSTYNWLKSLKMNLSALDLKQTRMKIYEIADKYGFADQFQYSHTFTRLFGMSPTRYRQIVKGERR